MAEKKKKEEGGEEKKSKPKKAKKSAARKKEPRDKLPHKTVAFTGKSHKKKTGRGPLVILAAAIVILVIALGWYQTQQLGYGNEEETSDLRSEISSIEQSLQSKLQELTNRLEEQKNKAEPEVEPLLTYANDRLGIAFQFSKDLGEVTEANEAGDPELPGDDLLRLTFSDNPDVWLTAVGPEYDGAEPFVNTGGEVDLAALCPNALEISGEGYCDLLTIAGQATIIQVQPVGDEQLLNVVASVPINLSKAPYSGLRLNLSLGLPPVSGRGIFSPADEEALRTALPEYLGNILKKENLSLIISENLQMFEGILQSLKNL